MTNAIKSFNNKSKSLITGRSIDPKTYTRTIHVNQTDGNFVVANPNKNNILVYGQSPNVSNSWFGSNKTISNLYDFGALSFPTDAKFDFVRRKIWVADTGNNRVLLIDHNTSRVDFEVNGLNFPCAIAINQSDGDVFVRDFYDKDNGIIHWMNKSGQKQDSIKFQDNFINSTFTIEKITQDGYDLPSPSTMDFDHVRNRLWWTANNKLYMADMNCMQISDFDFSTYDIGDISPVEVEYDTGNVFVGAYPSESKITADKRFSTLIYMYKDNNYPIAIMDVADSIGSGAINQHTQPSSWPDKIVFSDFDNPSMNGTWEIAENYRGQIYSYINPNNTLSFSGDNPKGQYGIGTYVLQPSGVFEWQFILYVIEDFPIIKQKWIYKKQQNNNKVNGAYELSSYYSYNGEVSNDYPLDSGMVSLFDETDESSSSGDEVSGTDVSSSSSFVFEAEYDPQIVYAILADQTGHHDLIPFAFSVDSNALSSNTTSIPFTFSNASYLDYSNVFSPNGTIQQFVYSNSSSTYVPQPDESRYLHTNEIYVDVIMSNSDSITTTSITSFDNGMHTIEPIDSFVIPKFSWEIKQIAIPEKVNVYSATITGETGS